MRPLRRADAPVRWWELAAGEDSVVTQVDDGFPVGPGDGKDLPTSSASMPSVVAAMLKYLDVHGGERVCEIGTGTGWNAALLAHRLRGSRPCPQGIIRGRIRRRDHYYRWRVIRVFARSPV